MKKNSYIILFVVLGVLLSFLTHALIEIPIIILLLSDFEKWGFGLSWDAWYMIHTIGTAALLVLGISIGFWQGRYWWGVIYVKNK